MGQKIEFTASVQDGAVVWSGPDGKPAKDHKVAIAHGAPLDQIEIRIKSDKSAKDLGLCIDTSAPFQVAQDNGQCPPQGINTDQIELVGCDSDSVTISNKNSYACTLRYQVNVVDKDGNPCPCDPIIQNGGAGPGM